MNSKSFGDYIRELREKKDFSLREFGKKLGGKSAAFLSDVELGRRFPTDELLEEMAHVLGVTVADLKNYDTRPPVRELKKLTTENPAYGIALRMIKDVNPEDLINFLNKNREKSKKK